MADETTPNQETQETQTTTNNVVDMDAKIRAGGQEIPVADLLKAKEDLEYLRQDYGKLVAFRDATTKVMRPDVDPSVKEQAARQLLVDMGYRGEEVDQYVQDWMNNQQGETVTDNTEDVGGDEDDRSAEEVANAILARTMLGKLEEINGKEALSGARAAIERDIRQQTLDNLRARRTQAGVFEEAWINEESAKATQQVLAKYRSVIGDPNRLGRAPETDSGAGSIFNRPAVPAPRWKPGVTAGDMESALDAFNKDALSRLAAGLDSGSDTRA